MRVICSEIQDHWQKESWIGYEFLQIPSRDIFDLDHFQLIEKRPESRFKLDDLV
jgi:hypothetical protein